jgi:hypothetical protein
MPFGDEGWVYSLTDLTRNTGRFRNDCTRSICRSNLNSSQGLGMCVFGANTERFLSVRTVPVQTDDSRVTEHWDFKSNKTSTTATLAVAVTSVSLYLQCSGDQWHRCPVNLHRTSLLPHEKSYLSGQSLYRKNSSFRQTLNNRTLAALKPS